MFLFSSIINHFLWQEAWQSYTLVQAIRLNPLQLDHYPTSFSTSQSDTPHLLFFGDSRAQAWHFPTDKFLVNVTNRGIGAQTTRQILHRFEAHVAPLNPDIILLQLGVNDLKTIPLFPEKKEQIVRDCQENIAHIVQKSNDMGAIVILTTVFPTADVPLIRQAVWSSEIESAIEEVNAFLMGLSSERVIVLDTRPILTDNNHKVKSIYALDTLHLNEQGYHTLNLHLMEILKDIYPNS